jgi:hypothetical protein
MYPKYLFQTLLLLGITAAVWGYLRAIVRFEVSGKFTKRMTFVFGVASLFMFGLAFSILMKKLGFR